MCRLFRGACRDACLTGLETALAGLAGGRATLVLVALHLLTGHVSPSVLVLHRTLLRPRPCGRSGDRAALRRPGEFLLDPCPWCSPWNVPWFVVTTCVPRGWRQYNGPASVWSCSTSTPSIAA